MNDYIIDDCDGCALCSNYCIFVKKKLKLECPCRICLFKTSCNTMQDICEEYKKLLNYCHTKE